jgi:LuxR family maltose regulon positive regulatory protein
LSRSKGSPRASGSGAREANLLAPLAHRELGDHRAATAAAECVLALAEADRLVLPFAVTGSLKLLKAISRHKTAHRALLTDVLGVMRGSSVPPGKSLHWQRSNN